MIPRMYAPQCWEAAVKEEARLRKWLREIEAGKKA